MKHIVHKDIPHFPLSYPISLEHKDTITSSLSQLQDGLSEHSFPNLYLFRQSYNYHLSLMSDDTIAIHGTTDGQQFWIFPGYLPDSVTFQQLVVKERRYVKCIPERLLPMAQQLAEQHNMSVIEDRNNFDYLYTKQDLALLSGRKYHKKRNLIHNFVLHNEHHSHVPLSPLNAQDAQSILDTWMTQSNHAHHNDYAANKEAIEQMERLNLHGYITYVAGAPVGFTIGEYINQKNMFIVHFEKANTAYKGLFQFINNALAKALDADCQLINREQDLGDEGLRQAKMTYRPVGFVKKYRLVHQ